MSTAPHMLSMALFYGGAGTHVFPVNERKEPLTGKGGFHHATTDGEQIEKWWTKWPDAGIATPDFDVVDVDLYKPECKPTWERIRPLIPEGTPHNRTGRGGLQFFFTPGTLLDGKIGPGVDNRYAGRNYVLLPPSRNETGAYETVVSVLAKRPKPAPEFPRESGENGEFRHLLNQMDAGETITDDRNKAAWWRAVEILRTLPANTDLKPVEALIQAWVDVNCGGNLREVLVAKQVRGAAKFVKDERLTDPGSPAAGHTEPRGPGRPLVWQRLSEIEMRSIVFRDKPFLQADAFHLYVGRKGVGKGTAIADTAARTTRGELGEKCNVVWIGTEDSAAIDIKPRIMAAEGDPQRVVLIKDWIQLPRDIKRMGNTLNEIGDVGLLIIDPVGNHITGKNSNSDTDIRDALAPLNGLADEHETMIIGVRHLSEKEAKAGVLAAILGASAWVQIPRAVIGIARDKNDARLSHIQCLSGNRLPPETSGRVFRIEGVVLEGLENEVTRAVWDGDSTENVEDLLRVATGAHDSSGSKSAEARDLILDILEQDGVQESDALDARVAGETELAAKTVRNVRGSLKNEGLIKALPEKDDTGTITRWMVFRTQAPRA